MIFYNDLMITEIIVLCYICPGDWCILDTLAIDFDMSEKNADSCLPLFRVSNHSQYPMFHLHVKFLKRKPQWMQLMLLVL